MPPALEAWSLNHWTSKEVPMEGFFLIEKLHSTSLYSHSSL